MTNPNTSRQRTALEYAEAAHNISSNTRISDSFKQRLLDNLDREMSEQGIAAPSTPDQRWLCATERALELGYDLTATQRFQIVESLAQSTLACQELGTTEGFYPQDTHEYLVDTDLDSAIHALFQ